MGESKDKSMGESVLEQLRAGPDFTLDDHRSDWLPRPWRRLDKDELKEATAEALEHSKESLEAAQELLYADDRYGLLLVFQAMDAAGKDGTIRHVMSGVNPQGCQVTSFKQPSAEELDHDFLWRCVKALPERGRIGIFNRSYYEEVLVARVHPGILDGEQLPSGSRGDKFWNHRYESINALERHLSRNGTAVVKFFLNVGRTEQKKRFLARLDEPEKTWKFSASDVAEREHWDEYMDAYTRAIRATSTAEAPWYVIPADHKSVMRALVAQVVSATIGSLDLRFPEVGEAERAEFERARVQLDAEKD
ncbi:MAG: polyphosphate kinase 2 family protein [Actinomycetes bacterium]